MAERRALTDEQNVIAIHVMAAIQGRDPADAFAAFASIMAATINGSCASQDEALARAEMWGQCFLDLLIEGRKGTFRQAGLQAIDTRYVL